MNKKFWITRLLAVIMVMNIIGVAFITVNANEIPATGNLGGGVTYTYNSETREVIISKTNEGSGIMNDFSASSPFRQSNIQNVVINEGVKNIGAQAFYRCQELQGVDIADSVTSIGNNAFTGCLSLPEITIPDTVTNIGGNAFANCSEITEIRLPSGISELESSTFFQCSNLSNVYFSSNITSIGESAFYECSQLQTIIFPENLEIISKSAFDSCSNLTTVVFPDSLITIKEGAFCHCYSLADVNVPANVEFIGTEAFSDCKNVYIDKNNSYFVDEELIVYSKDRTRLLHCSTEYAGTFVAKNVLSVIDESAFSSCKSLNEVDLSATSITSIPNAAFRYCSNLDSVYIPKSVTSINQAAFYDDTNLKSIIIPENCKYIGKSAFRNTDISRKFIAKNLYDVVIETGNNKGINIENWKAISIGNIQKNNDDSICISLDVDETNPINEIKYDIGEHDKAYFQTNGQNVEKKIILSDDIKTVSFYSKDICGNETVSICSIPSIVAPTATEITYEQSLADAALIGGSVDGYKGTWSWKNTSEIPIAGTSEYEVIFVSSDNKIKASAFIPITVKKATSEYTLPTDIEIEYTSNLTLEKVLLPDGWKWDNPSLLISIPGGEYSASYTPKDTINYVGISGVNIPIKVVKHTPIIGEAPAEVILPTAKNIIYTQPLSAALLDCSEDSSISGTWTWQTPNIIPDAGRANYTAIFTPDDTENYNTVTAEIEVTINKAEPEYEIPLELTAVYSPNLTLTDISLPGGFAWNEPDTTLQAGTKTYKASFMPEDTKNYQIVNDIEIEVNIEKYVPIFGGENADINMPYASNIIYGQMLVDSVLTSDSNDKVKGVWTWQDGNVIPNTGTTTHTAIFTPDDAMNYDIVTAYVEMTVEKAQPEYTIPTGLTVVYSPSLTLANILLPDGFTWKEPDTPLIVPGGTYAAVYSSTDNNYNPITDVFVSVEVTKYTPVLGVDIQIPTASEIVYGKTLADSILTSNDNDKINGKWTWEVADIKPYKGTSEYNAIFTPDENTNYQSLTSVVSIKVNSSYTSSGRHSGGGRPILSEEEPPKDTNVDTNNVDSNTEEYDSPYITGYQDNTFRPENPITRAEAVTAIVRAAKLEVKENSKITFPDTKNHWAKKYIDALADLKVINGYNDGKFIPDVFITRAEFSKIIKKVCGYETMKGAAKFIDTKDHWAEPYIAVLAEKDIIKGYNDNTFRPDELITRAEAVTFINNAISRNCSSKLNMSFTDISLYHWAYDEILKASGYSAI